METPPFNRSAAAAHEVGWYPDLAKMREALLAKLGDGLNQDRADDLAFFTDAEATRDKLAHCGQPDAQPACHVTQKFIYQVLRGFSKEQVFAQTLLGFETISADPRRIVGINFVMPEDGRVSMADFEEQMKMLDYLHSVYPKVHITMHAGELAPGLVPYEGLCCHIHWAVELGHAERIGHGVDIMHELDSYKLMDIMANNHVMVEIALSSNDLILGISGKDHPFPIYRKHNVPVSLSTDDEGVSRIDLTHEYVRAVETYNLRYADLKQMVRTGMEHSFQQGESLWAARDVLQSRSVSLRQRPTRRRQTQPALRRLPEIQRKSHPTMGPRTPLPPIRIHPPVIRPDFGCWVPHPQQLESAGLDSTPPLPHRRPPCSRDRLADRGV